MIPEFVDIFMTEKEKLEAVFAEKHPKDYAEIVKAVITLLSNSDKLEEKPQFKIPDSNKISILGNEHHHKELLFIIISKGYFSLDCWFVKVVCGAYNRHDTLLDITAFGSSGKPTVEQTKDYMTLALCIVQGIKKLE